MGEIDSVNLVEERVFQDLSSSKFTDAERERVFDGIDELEEQLTTWGRPLNKCVDIINTNGPETVYRRREGHLRMYFVRERSTLHCIGVGKRKKTYDRDLGSIIERARDLLGL